MNIKRATTRRTTKRTRPKAGTTRRTPANRPAAKRTTAKRAPANRATAGGSAKVAARRRRSTSLSAGRGSGRTAPVRGRATARRGMTSLRTRPAGLRRVRAALAPASVRAQALLASLRPAIRGAGPAAREAKRHAERIEFSLRRLDELTEIAFTDGGAFTPARAEVAGSILQIHLDAAASFLGLGAARSQRRRAA